MAELNVDKTARHYKIRYRGRLSQMAIYFGKLLRMFIYQNDWKVLPMATLIAGMVGMVTRIACFTTLEGTLFGSFAMVCVCVWNGCFNSIQVICRERDVIKREHRSGMHVSTYILSHMIYQALLCLAQTAVTINVTILVGVPYPEQGLITQYFLFDYGISMFLITYASDMLSLWVSSIAHNTTTAMTIMPFVLIFQLVFSGGMLPLPEWTKPLTNFTISNPGLKVLAAQSDTNNRPYESIALMVSKMRDNEIGGTVTVGQVMDLLQDPKNEAIQELRGKEIGRVFTLGELKEMLDQSATFEAFEKEHILEDVTVNDVVRFMMESEELADARNMAIGTSGLTLGSIMEKAVETDLVQSVIDTKLVHLTTVGDVLKAIDAKGLLEKYSDVEIGGKITVGEAVDMLARNADVQARRDTEITVKTSLGKVLDIIGEDNVKTFLEEKAAAASYNPDYDCSVDTVLDYWMHLSLFIWVFALLAMITLEFIDKDKR